MCHQPQSETSLNFHSRPVLDESGPDHTVSVSQTFFRPLLTICTALSAGPFEAGWYGAEVVCLMPEKRFEFFTHEPRTVVGDNHLWKTEFGERCAKFLDDGIRRRGRCAYGFNPL